MWGAICFKFSLRRLVTALTLTMIFGLLTIIGLFVMRFSSDNSPAPMASELKLPDGQTAVSYSEGLDFFAVVTTGNPSGDLILIYNRDDNTLRQTMTVMPK